MPGACRASTVLTSAHVHNEVRTDCECEGAAAPPLYSPSTARTPHGPVQGQILVGDTDEDVVDDAVLGGGLGLSGSRSTVHRGLPRPGQTPCGRQQPGFLHGFLLDWRLPVRCRSRGHQLDVGARAGAAYCHFRLSNRPTACQSATSSAPQPLYVRKECGTRSVAPSRGGCPDEARSILLFSRSHPSGSEASLDETCL